MQTGILFERNDDMADTEKKTAKYRFLVDTIKEKIKNADIWSEVLGSDHCPVVLELDV